MGAEVLPPDLLKKEEGSSFLRYKIDYIFSFFWPFTQVIILRVKINFQSSASASSSCRVRRETSGLEPVLILTHCFLHLSYKVKWLNSPRCRIGQSPPPRRPFTSPVVYDGFPVRRCNVFCVGMQQSCVLKCINQSMQRCCWQNFMLCKH